MIPRLKSMHHIFWTLLVLLTGSHVGDLVAAAAQERPNFIFILIDDLGYKDLGCYGSTFYETPHVDALAREGMKFTNGYAACPVCSPTRASLLTGRYPARIGQTDWIPGRSDRHDQRLRQVEDLNYLPREEITIAELLKASGYVTGAIGKWHLGGEGYLPTDQGFDVNIAGNSRGSPPSYFYPYRRGDYQLEELAASGRSGEYLTDRLGEEAARFIEENSEEPFFLYFANYAVHTPLQSKRDLTEKYEAKSELLPIWSDWVFGAEGPQPVRQVQNHPVYAGMIQSMDESVGRILRALEENDLQERTIIFFFSDNGGLSTSEGWPTSNLPLRAGKGWSYEGGIRVPLIIKWPGTTKPASRCDVPVISVDFFPTILQMAGLSAPEALVLDGVSLVPLLKRADYQVAREAIYWHYPHYSNQGGGQSGVIREGDFKLIHFYEDNRVELYHLKEDIGERHDLTPVLPETARTLNRKFRHWLDSVGAVMPEPNPDYVPPRGLQ